MTRALDLGCGQVPQNICSADELWGIDLFENRENNVLKCDLVLDPIPFRSDYFDRVTARDFLEHIPRLIYAPKRRYPFVELMNEIWRVLAPGGQFVSLTPAIPDGAEVVFRDPTHVNYITQNTLEAYFCAPQLWASIYGFHGKFKYIEPPRWVSYLLIEVLEKPL